MQMSCIGFFMFGLFFFFKQKTEYEMRISDWSSDVCSSDLNLLAYAWTGNVSRRRGEGFTVASGVRPCTDGYINLLGGQRLPQLLRMIGRDDLAEIGRASCRESVCQSV